VPTDTSLSSHRGATVAGTFSVGDVAGRYGVTIPTVLAWIHAGELRALNVSRSARSRKPRWRITSVALEAFEQLRSITTVPPKPRRRRQSSDVILFYT
jgi:hypothetical protein